MVKKYKNVVVLGCSFSDYTGHPPATYGQLLADKFDSRFMDLTAGCGSNERIHRVLLHGLRNNLITDEDLVVIQYTNPERREFTIRRSLLQYHDKTKPYPDYYNSDYKGRDLCDLNEIYTELYGLVKYKVDAHEWHKGKAKDFLKTFTDNHLCLEYQAEIFLNYHEGITSSLKYRNIDTLILYTPYIHYHPFEEIANILKEGQNIFNAKELLFRDPNSYEKYWLEDKAHINYAGHNLLAEEVYKFLV